MELPIAVKISRKIDGSELYNGLRHLLGPAHAGALHAIFNQVLASSFDRATGNRPTVGEVFVIAHSRAVAIEVTGDPVQRLAFRAGQATFGDTLDSSSSQTLLGAT